MNDPVIRQNGEAEVVPISNGTALVRIPIQLRRRSGKRRLRFSKVEQAVLSSDLTVLQAALARGYRWRNMLDNGDVASMQEIADFEKVHHSYVARMINTTLLSPDIVEAILDDTLTDLTLNEIAIAPPDLWNEQRTKFGITSS